MSLTKLKEVLYLLTKMKLSIQTAFKPDRKPEECVTDIDIVSSTMVNLMYWFQENRKLLSDNQYDAGESIANIRKAYNYFCSCIYYSYDDTDVTCNSAVGILVGEYEKLNHLHDSLDPEFVKKYPFRESL